MGNPVRLSPSLSPGFKFKPKTSVVKPTILSGMGAGPFSPGAVSSHSKQCFDTPELLPEVVLATSGPVRRARMSPVRTDDAGDTFLLT
jgi:hypothetical protein